MLNSAPNDWTLASLAKHVTDGPQAGLPNGSWEPARPMGYFSLWSRLRLAWAVFTGRADALFWPNQAEP